MLFGFPQKKGQRKTQDPCQGCFLHKTRCLCELIPQLRLKTKLSLIIHAKELKRTTNTGVLATRALLNSQIFVRGNIHDPLDMSRYLNPSYRDLLFYPSDDAVELNPDVLKGDSRPINLIVPDGNWRQASKIHYRQNELRQIPRVKISAPNLARRHLRKETMPEGMATLQAIALAFGVLEGVSIQEQLLRLYEEKLNRTLEGRGQEQKA